MTCKTALMCRWHISFCSQGETCQGTGHGKDHKFSGYRLELGEAARPTAGCRSVRGGGILRREDFTGLAGSRFSVASQKQHMTPAENLTKSVWTQSRKPCTTFTQKYLINDSCCYCLFPHNWSCTCASQGHFTTSSTNPFFTCLSAVSAVVCEISSSYQDLVLLMYVTLLDWGSWMLIKKWNNIISRTPLLIHCIGLLFLLFFFFFIVFNYVNEFFTSINK